MEVGQGPNWGCSAKEKKYAVGTTPWKGDQPVARPLPTHRTRQTQNKRKQTSMPRVGFKTTTQVFELGKTVHALARAAGHCDRLRHRDA
jgi:hypothetical protein